MPNPRSLVGKLLQKVKSKKAPEAPTAPPAEPPKAPAGGDAVLAIEAEVKKYQKVLDALMAAAAKLPEGSAKTNLLKACAQVGTQLSSTSALPDAPARAQRLMLVGEALGKLKGALDQASAIEAPVRSKTPPESTPPTGAPTIGPADLAQAFKERLTELVPAIKIMLAGGGERATQAQQLNAQAVALAKQKLFDQALVVLGDLAKLLEHPASSGQAQPPQSEEEQALKVEEQKARQKAQAEALENLRKAQATMGQLRVQITADLGQLPVPVLAQFNAIDKLLALGKGIEPSAIEAAIDEANDIGAAIEQAAKDLLAERQKYLMNWALLNTRVQMLRNHPAAARPEVKPKIDAVLKAVDDAKALAQDSRYTEAQAAIKDTPAACDAAETLADQIMRYLALLADARGSVATLSNSAHAPAQALVTAAHTKLTQAETHATSGAFDRAIPLLTALPQDCIDANWAVKSADEYTTMLAEQTQAVSNAKTWGSVDEMSPYMPGVELLLQNANFTVTNDYAESVTRLKRVTFKLGELWKIIGHYRKYTEAKALAKQKIQDLDNHPGAPGIAALIVRIKSDYAFAQTKRQANEYTTAKNLMTEVVARADEAVPKAVESEAYATLLVDTNNKRAALTGATEAFGASLLAEADRLIALAQTKALTHDFAAATDDLQKARQWCADAAPIVNNQALVARWAANAEPLINAIDTDFQAAYDDFIKVHQKVSGVSGASGFKAELKAAKQQADQAKADGTGPTPNWPVARQALRAAYTACNDVLRQINQLAVHKALLSNTQSNLKALKKADKTKALVTAVTDIELKITQAEEAAKVPDYQAAHARLLEADALVSQGLVDVQYVEAFDKRRKGDVATLLAAIDTPVGQEAVGREVEAVKTAVVDAEQLKTNLSFVPAYEALMKTVAEAQRLQQEIANYQEIVKFRKAKILDRIGPIQKEAVLRTHYNEIINQLAEVTKQLSDRQFIMAFNIAVTAHWGVNTALQVLTRYQAYAPEHLKATTALAQLKAVPSEALKDEVLALEALLKQAEDLAKDHVYETAMPLLAQVLARSTAGVVARDAQLAYAEALKRTQDAAAALTKDFPADQTVQLQLDEVSARLAQAAQLAAAKQYEQARTHVEGALLSCAQARALGQNQAEVQALAQQLQSRPTDQLDGLDAELAKVRALIDSLTLRNLGPVLEGLLALALKHADAAQQAIDEGKAALACQSLAEAAKAGAQAQAAAEQFTLVDEAIKNAHVNVTAAVQRHTEPPYVVSSLKGLLDQLALANADAQGSMFSSAQTQVRSVRADLLKLVDLATLHVQYQQLRLPLAPRVEALSKSGARHSIADALKTLLATMAQADDKAQARSYPEAITLLKAATDQCDVAALQSDMHEQKEPTEQAIKAILDKPDGDKQLDAIIATLPKSAKRKVCQLAFELRFGSKLALFTDTKGQIADTDQDAKAPDILRFYETMKDLPRNHTKDNPCLSKIVRQGDEVDTSWYDANSREVVLCVGRGTDKTGEVIGQEWELGPVDPESQPADDEAPSTFEWTTLHEIGHAEDDRQAFMKKNGSQDAYGGWIEYGANVSEIARVAATHFGYDQAYVAKYLVTPDDKHPRPPAPSGTSEVDWDRHRIEVETWCDSIREKKNLYASASACEKAAIGGRIYQEAYSRQWVSYKAEARRKGITGYQFRAPGEWFAELYAAYHTGKLKPTHPAVAWLSTI